MRWLLWVVLGAAVGCDSQGRGGTTGDGGVDDAGAGDGAAAGDATVFADAAPPISLTSVPGELVYASLAGADGHLFSVLADGTGRRQITTEPGRYSFPAVGAEVGGEPRYVAAVRREAEGGPGEVVVVDVKERTQWAITPEGCDAGIGGVGWINAGRVMFAMDCGDGPSQAYVSLFDNRARDRAAMVVATASDDPVRDVFPAVRTSFFAYVVDREVCNDGCVIKPQIRVGDAETLMSCVVTEGDLGFTDVTTLSAGGRRLGDHQPTFNRDLTALLFSRNVGGKPPGPEGHHDLMRIGIDLRRLSRGGTCAVTDTLTNVTDEGLDERYPTAGGGETEGDERYPQAAAGRAPSGMLLFTAQTHDGDGTSSVWAVNLSGARIAVTDPLGSAGFARWVVLDYTTDGER